MWRRKRTPEQELAAELRYHLDSLVREYVRSGLSAEEAERRARREFGAVEQIKDDCRDVRGQLLTDLAKDLLYAARSIRRSPGFAAAAVLSLALGIGANSAIFSLINAVMLRSLPVREPGRLVLITRPRDDGSPGAVSYPVFEQFRDHLKSISAASAEMNGRPLIAIDGADEDVSTQWIAGSYFAVLGVQPAAGRLLGPEDDMPEPEAPAAMISYRYWQRRFGLNPAAVGKTFSLHGRIFTIVGITPKGFSGTRPGFDLDVLLPLQTMLTASQRTEKTNNMLTMLARLRPGIPVQQADAEVRVLWTGIVQGIAAESPAKDRPAILRQRAAAVAAPGGFNPLMYSYGRALLLLMGIVGLVLLLACMNLSGLLMARAVARQREVSIRLAIGAGRGRLMRQFLAESLLLAGTGGSMGLLLAQWFGRTLVTLLANGGPRLLLPVSPDWRVLAFTASISLLACVLVGLAPGFRAIRVSINPSLKDSGGQSNRGLGRGLVSAQVAISMVLLVAATLFIGTLVRLHSVDRGIKTDGILAFGFRISQPYPPHRAQAVQHELLERISGTPGVAAATAVQVLPIGGGLWSRNIEAEGYPLQPGESPQVGFNVIAPDYFSTVDTPMLLGREFDKRDTGISKKVTVVNESFARHFFGTQSPIGRHVTSLNVVYEIVGVAKDAVYQTLRDSPIRTMYIPWTQRDGDQPSSYVYLARAAAGDPLRLTAALEHAGRQVDPSLRMATPRTYSEIVDSTILTERLMALLGAFFGSVAVVIACLGMFGLMAFQVSRRIGELGVRMALGAQRRDIVALVLRGAGAMLVTGALAGAAAGMVLSRLTAKLLFGVKPTEPGVYVLAAVVLCASGLVAAWIPARRASRIDPMAALRHE